MSETAKLISVYGPLTVIMAVFIVCYFTDRKERKQERDKFMEVADKFAITSSEFCNVMANHMEHETEALRELTTAIQRLCVYLEVPNRDYFK